MRLGGRRGYVVGVTDVVDVDKPWKLATVIVTVEPALASEPPLGDWLTTLPSFDGSRVGCFTTLTLKPLLCRAEVALACESPTTDGTVLLDGPDETRPR